MIDIVRRAGAPFDDVFNMLPIRKRLRFARACCANPSPQILHDKAAGAPVLCCMGCGAFAR